MKKRAISLLVFASLAIPPTVFALTAMDDAGMKAATGQAGVSITVDNVVIEQFTGSTSYTDETGTTGTAGSIVISDKHVVKQYLAMTSDAVYQTRFNAVTGANAYTYDHDNNAATAEITLWNKAAALTIDVGTCTVLQAGLNDNLSSMDLVAIADWYNAVPGMVIPTMMANGLTYDEATAIIGAATNGNGAAQDVVGVVIGLPTLLISTTADEYTVGVAKAGAINDGAEFISIAKGAGAMAILGGNVEIAAH
ncbi:hypothetical protein JCM14469_00010 [Desulfatiferula olefinivorans]